MGIELSKGDIFITMGDKTMPFAKGISVTEEVELSANENPAHLYHFDDTLSCNLEVGNSDLSDLSNVCGLMPNQNLTIYMDIKIMIQARWHKKPRIRKKWLKRFGMKSDTVKMKMDATALEYYPGHILDEQYDDSGICATFGSFEFETNNREYLWRPDQLRKDIKIEWM